jgi:hypothetical protein
MKNSVKILILLIFMIYANNFTAYADMNLEVSASVSGMSVALNNFYARNISPEEQLEKTVRKAVNSAREEEFALNHVNDLVKEVEEKESLKLIEDPDYEDMVLAYANDYENLYESADTDSKVIGKLYKNSVAKIVETTTINDDKWYKVSSGSVTAYIRADQVLGRDALCVDDSEITHSFATIINTDNLRLRSTPDVDAKTLTLLSKGATYNVIGEEGDFLKLQIDDDLVGYAFKDYISVDTRYNEAISIEEENTILAEKKQREKEADEAIARLESDRAKESEAKLALSNESNNIESVKERNSKEASKKESTKKETKTEENSTKESTKKETKASTVQTRSKENATVETKFADNTTIEKSKKETTKTETAKKESSKQESETAKPKKETKAATVPAGGDERDAIVAYAKQFLGNPYKYGGTSLTDGCDCSGFTMQVYSKFGYSIGRDSRTQSNASGNAIDESSLRKGDLIFYASDDTINHVGIYIGDGKIIHSSNSRTGITISPANYRSPAKILNILD